MSNKKPSDDANNAVAPKVDSKPQKTKDSNKQQTDKRMAHMINDPAILSAAITESYAKPIKSGVDILSLVDELNDSINKVQSGDLQELEAMLLGQAKALQTMFMNLALVANQQDYLKQYSTYMNLAFKSQSQSRATIQALVELKYPRQMIVTQQANISQGHQQINNGVVTTSERRNQYAHTHAGKNQIAPNELLESQHEHTQNPNQKNQRLDSRTTGTPITGDTTMETMVTINRSNHPRG